MQDIPGKLSGTYARNFDKIHHYLSQQIK